MVKLTELGYLKKPHASAGRVPTSIGMKFYVQQLMKEKELSVADEVSVKEKVWDYRDRVDRFMKELAKSLAARTKALAVVTTESGDLYAAGYANILDMPEFYDIDLTKTLLEITDEVEYFTKLCQSVSGEDVHVLLGEDLGPRLSGPYGFVFKHFQTPQHLAGEIGVLGSTRLNYTAIVPMVRYFGNLIEEVAHGW
jgi:heat-inducible transcriptional repressor